MFPEDYLLDPQPAMTRRERQPRRDADRSRDRGTRFVEGYFSAERDHEDGASVEGIYRRACELMTDGDVHYHAGRMAYARGVTRG